MSLFAAVLTLAGIVASVAPAAAQEDNSFILVNSASLGAGAMARGGFITIFTERPVTNETVANPFPWATSAGGVSVQTDRCNPQDVPAITNLPILSVGPSGTGTQINLYYPNDIGVEPFGTCNGGGSFDLFTIRAKIGFQGSAFGSVVRTVPSQPGIYQDGQAPAGYHLNAATRAETPFTQCNSDPARCPVSTAGQQNFLIAFTTGAEVWSCPTAAQSCAAPRRISFRLAAPGGPPVEQQLTFFGPAGFLGQEQANIRINPGTAAGEYRLSPFVPTSTFNNQQQLLVRLGSAT